MVGSTSTKICKNSIWNNQLYNTKADILNNFDEIKICVKYKIGNEEKEIPSSSCDFFKAEPVYETLKGWPETNHITFIEKYTSIKIKYISYEPKIEEMCYREDLNNEDVKR